MIKIFLLKLKEEGWTQQAIADKAGLSQNMVSNFLKGKTCTVETLVKIAKAFGVSTDTVLGLEDPAQILRSNSSSEDLRLTRRLRQPPRG